MKGLMRVKNSNFDVVVNKTGSTLNSGPPIVLKNQITEIRSIEDIADVSEVNVTAGATIVYNSENDKYEVRKLLFEDVDTSNASYQIDGGSF
jgi:hypothetical protein